MGSATNTPTPRRNPVRATAVATPWRVVNNKQRRLELMSAAPRDQLNEDERRQLDNHRARQARDKSRRAAAAADGYRAPSSGYDTPPSTHPTTGSAANTPSDTRLSSSPDMYHGHVANAQEDNHGDSNWAPVGASTAGLDDQRDNQVARETASTPKPHDPADERENHIPGSIDKVRAEEWRTGYTVTGYGGSRRPTAGHRQTQLVTPGPCARDQGRPTPWRFHNRSPTPDSALVFRAGAKAHARDQERHLRLTIGPVSVEAQLHAPSGGRDGGELAEESRELDEIPLQEGHVPVLVIDLGSVLFCVGIITILSVLWGTLSM